MGHYLIHTVEIFMQNESFYAKRKFLCKTKVFIQNETFMKHSKQVKGNLVI